jgi:hypothetical protein
MLPEKWSGQWGTPHTSPKKLQRNSLGLAAGQEWQIREIPWILKLKELSGDTATFSLVHQ